MTLNDGFSCQEKIELQKVLNQYQDDFEKQYEFSPIVSSLFLLLHLGTAAKSSQSKTRRPLRTNTTDIKKSKRA